MYVELCVMPIYALIDNYLISNDEFFVPHLFDSASPWPYNHIKYRIQHVSNFKCKENGWTELGREPCNHYHRHRNLTWRKAPIGDGRDREPMGARCSG